MRGAKTKEPQYQICLDLAKNGTARLGLMVNQGWHDDPKRLVFTLSRYKFIAKMLAGYGRVLEVGCADAFGTRIVRQHVERLTATDFDPVFIEDARACQQAPFEFECEVHDMLAGPMLCRFDAAYALDVLEHIQPDDEPNFLRNVVDSLTDSGVLIIGIPSIQSQTYASQVSRQGHINCKDHQALKRSLSAYFQHVFIFSMNDEVVHTGFYEMAHYLLALCCGKNPRLEPRE